MDDTLYVAMTGANRALEQQAVYSNNLANANTSGFRADLYQAESVAVSGPSFASQVFVAPQKSATDFTPGTVMTTGRDLDIAIIDKGWLAVQSSSGQEAYTRSGDLQINSNGILTNSKGLPILGNGGPIALPPAKKIQIARDGTISIIPIGQDAKSIAVVDRIRLVNPADSDLTKGTDGLMYLKNGASASADASVVINQGSLETSNVNAIENMINMISASRNFEMQLKLMQTVDEGASALAQVLQIS